MSHFDLCCQRSTCGPAHKVSGFATFNNTTLATRAPCLTVVSYIVDNLAMTTVMKSFIATRKFARVLGDEADPGPTPTPSQRQPRFGVYRLPDERVGARWAPTPVDDVNENRPESNQTDGFNPLSSLDHCIEYSNFISPKKLFCRRN